MKKLLLLGIFLTPIMLFASGGGEETDIVQRSVNFIIFAVILWYLLADKIKAFFVNRSLFIQSELDKVKDALKASEEKVDDATKKLQEAKQLAKEIVETAKQSVDSIEQKVITSVEAEIVQLQKSFDEKNDIELKRAKRRVVSEILKELFDSSDIELTQDELANIVLKRVA